MTTDWDALTPRARSARHNLRHRQNEARGFSGLHGAKRVARGDYWGGYVHYVLTNDGGILCPACVRAEWRNIVDSFRRDIHDGWYPAGIVTDGDFDVEPEWCAHCGTEIHERYDDDDDTLRDWTEIDRASAESDRLDMYRNEY